MIDKETIERVKESADIVDVISDFYQLTRRGSEYECHCPFHEDRHLGNFKISPKKNFAKCFACGWQGGSVDFLMEHERLSFADAIRWLGKKYGIEVEGSEQFNVPFAQARKPAPQLPMLELPMQMVTHSERQLGQCTLVEWLREGIRWSSAQRSQLEQAIKDYHLGASRQGHAMFWQIDDKQRVRTGKMMLYKSNGHRDKEAPHNFDWVHSMLYRMDGEWSANKADMKTCLFGLHLLDKYKEDNAPQDVCIVESEKTAIIMAAAYGNNNMHVWMASGGLGNITREKLEPIMQRRRHIILYPDRDGVEEWRKRAIALNYPFVSVEAQYVMENWIPADGPKADIADIVVRIINESLEDKMAKSEPLAKLVEEFQLEEINQQNEKI